MNSVKVSLDSKGYKSKPTGGEVGIINNRICKNDRVVALEEIEDFKVFAEYVGENGVTFCPATFHNEIRNVENFKEMQLLVLDFETGIALKNVVDRTKKYNIPMLMAYETLTEGENRFRVLFKNNTSIDDKKLAKITLNGLITIFPEADQSCDDISRMFFGGKKLLYFDDSLPTVDPELILRNMTYYLKDKRRPQHYKEYIKKFAKKHGIRLTKKGLLDISMVEETTESTGTSQNGKKLHNSILLYKTNGKNFPNSYYRLHLDEGDTNGSMDKKVLKTRKDFPSGLLPELSNSCQLFREFETGEKWLGHDELFGLSTNIIHVESGIDIFKKILAKYPDYYNSDKQNQFDYYLRYNKDHDYAPQSCEFFCPYKDTCNHGRNILSTAKPKMEKLANYHEVFYPLKEVEEDVRRAIFNAYHSAEKMMSIIKAQTSIGKTTGYLQLMEENPCDRFLISCPTNILKDEVHEKAVKAGLKVMKTPSLEEIKDKLPVKVRKHIAMLYQTGKHHLVHPYITEILKKKNIACLKEYMDEREKMKSFDGSVITTHRYMLNMDEKRLREYDAVIIDEDVIFKSIISHQGKIPVSELKKILKSATDGRLIKKIKKLIKHFDSETMSKIELPAFEWDDEDEEAEGMSTPFDIPSFCSAKYFYFRRASKEKNLEEDTIVFLKPVTFYNNVKYIMVSATVDEKICSNYFGEENISFYECKKVEYTGTLYQYHGKSMSRSSIGNDPLIIKLLMKKFGIDENKVITHKKYDIGELHYGNTEGCNSLEGQDILVIGTPYHAQFIYELFAFSLGIDFDEDIEMKRDRIVTHNGYLFPCTTYDNEELRAIHFWMLESELEQAVGRARLLRRPCTVRLFSNFPICQSVMKDDEYWRS